jgi:hypothetical protein
MAAQVHQPTSVGVLRMKKLAREGGQRIARIVVERALRIEIGQGQIGSYGACITVPHTAQVRRSMLE